MIEPRDFLVDIIDPPLLALSEAMGRSMATDEARSMLLAIAMQESNLEYRKQVGGPARGWWQFEKMGGTNGVLTHASSAEAAKAVCAALYVPATVVAVYEAIAWHDHLAAAFARLLLFTDAKPLPPVGDEDEAWDCYTRSWRPGKPHRDRWAKAYPLAVNIVIEEKLAVRIAPIGPKDQPPIAAPAEQPAAMVAWAKSKGWVTSEFVVTILTVAGLFGTTLLDQMTMLSPAMRDASWVSMAYVISRALPKAAALFPVDPKKAG